MGGRTLAADERSPLLEATLRPRRPDEGRGWQTEYEGVTIGVHERGRGPGDRGALPYLEVADLDAALEQVRALGGEIVHPGERWAICRDSEGTPFGLAGPAPEQPEMQSARGGGPEPAAPAK